MSLQRIEILGVPVDVCPRSELEEVIIRLLDDTKRPKQIVFLTVWDLLRARGNTEYAECLKNADLILPTSKSILGGAKFLKKTLPVRYNPFNAVISILTTLESRYKSFFLLGGKKNALVTAERNVRSTFKGLQIVGRYVGYFKKDAEPGITEAIRKASPSLLLVSDGIREKDSWAYSRRDRLGNGISLYYKDAVGIFSKRTRRINPKSFDRGFEIWEEILKNPLKIFLIFPFTWYIILLIWNRIFLSE